MEALESVQKELNKVISRLEGIHVSTAEKIMKQQRELNEVIQWIRKCFS